MTYVSEAPRAASDQSPRWFSDLMASFKHRQEQRRAYIETLGQLSAMTDSELADIGLSRLMIRDVAMQAAYTD